MSDRIEPLTSHAGAPAAAPAGSGLPAFAALGVALVGAALAVVAFRRRRRRRANPSADAGDGPFRLLFENHPAPAWAFDELTLRFVAVNDAVLRRFGYSREQLLALTVRDVSPAEDADRLAAGPGGPVQWRHRSASGAPVATEVTSRRLADAGRQLRLVVATDAVERRKAEGELKERDELLRDVLAHVPCAVFWKDRASIYIGCNEQAAKDRGLGVPGEVIGQTDYDFAHTPEEAEQSRAGDRKVIETATPSLGVEETRLLASGQKATFLTDRVPLRDSSGAVVGVVGVSQNVTDRKRLEEELRHAHKMEAIGRLAGGVAHDFNNLLTVLTGSIHLIRTLPPGSPAVRGHVDDIEDAVERATALTRQLLAFSRKQPMRPEVLDLNEVVSGLAGLLRRLIGTRIAVRTELAGEPVRVRADRGHLEQVLMNLAINARDAMPAGGTLTVATGVDPARKQVRLTGTDSGWGMAVDEKAKIFEPFFTTKEVGKGTGLGLATVHGIVVQAGGGIEVASAPGEGTTFFIRLPRCDAPPAVHATPAPVAPFATSAGRAVLLVEDEERIRTQVGAMLEGWGYAVTTADGAESALALLTPDRALDLLVTDLVMPGTDGRELAARVQAERPGVGVVFISGFVPDAQRPGPFADAVFLPKPFAPLDLIRCTERALRQRNAPAPATGGHAQ